MDAPLVALAVTSLAAAAACVLAWRRKARRTPRTASTTAMGALALFWLAGAATLLATTVQAGALAIGPLPYDAAVALDVIVSLAMSASLAGLAAYVLFLALGSRALSVGVAVGGLGLWAIQLLAVFRAAAGDVTQMLLLPLLLQKTGALGLGAGLFVFGTALLAGTGLLLLSGTVEDRAAKRRARAFATGLGAAVAVPLAGATVEPVISLTLGIAVALSLIIHGYAR